MAVIISSRSPSEMYGFKRKDTSIIDFKEALHLEKIRNTFFIRLYELLENA